MARLLFSKASRHLVGHLVLSSLATYHFLFLVATPTALSGITGTRRILRRQIRLESPFRDQLGASEVSQPLDAGLRRLPEPEMTTDKPNWVGHLIQDYGPGSDILVYDYAVGGDRVPGVKSQITNHFLPHVGEKPAWAPWTSDDTLFGQSRDILLGHSQNQ